MKIGRNKGHERTVETMNGDERTALPKSSIKTRNKLSTGAIMAHRLTYGRGKNVRGRTDIIK